MTALPFRLKRMLLRNRVRPRVGSGWRSVFVAMLALVALAPVCSVRADDPIKGEVKAVADGGYLRLTFQFDEAVEATTRISGAIVVISFNKPVALAVERLNVNAPDFISAARRDPDGSAIRIALTRKVKLNTISAAEKLYVDLLPENWKGPMPGLPQEVVDELVRRARDAERQLHQQRAADKQKKPPLVRVKVASQPTFVRYVFTMPGTVNVVPERADGRVTLNFDQQVNWDLADAKASLPQTLKSIEAEVDFDSVAVVFTLNGTPEVRTFREDRSIVVDIGLDGAKAKQAEEGAAARQAPDPTPKISLPETKPSKGPAAEIQPKAAPPKMEASAPPIATPAPETGSPAKDDKPTKRAATISPSPPQQSQASSEPITPAPASIAPQAVPATVAEPSPAPPPVAKTTQPFATDADAVRPKANPNAVVVATAQQSGDSVRVDFPFAGP